MDARKLAPLSFVVRCFGENMRINSLLKTIFLIFVIVILGFSSWMIYGYYKFFTWTDDIWTIENRTILREYVSPDTLRKIGLYHYDSGALGYTAIQMSLVDIGKEYPISGNILQINSPPPEIRWVENNQIYVILDTFNTPGFKIDRNVEVDSIRMIFEIK